MGLMNGADPLQLGRLGVVTGTTAPTRLPTGSLVGTSSKCASWITSLTKPFDNYFEIYKTKQQQEFLLKQQAQQGTTALEIQKAKTQNIYFTAVALIAGAVIIGAFK